MYRKKAPHGRIPGSRAAPSVGAAPTIPRLTARLSALHHSREHGAPSGHPDTRRGDDAPCSSLGWRRICPPIIRRQCWNQWLNDALLVQLVRSDQHERFCPAITSISHAEGRWFDPSRDHHCWPAGTRILPSTDVLVCPVCVRQSSQGRVHRAGPGVSHLQQRRSNA